MNEDTILRLDAVWVDVPPDLEDRVRRALARERRTERDRSHRPRRNQS